MSGKNKKSRSEITAPYRGHVNSMAKNYVDLESAAPEFYAMSRLGMLELAVAVGAKRYEQLNIDKVFPIFKNFILHLMEEQRTNPSTVKEVKSLLSEAEQTVAEHQYGAMLAIILLIQGSLSNSSDLQRLAKAEEARTRKIRALGDVRDIIRDHAKDSAKEIWDNDTEQRINSIKAMLPLVMERLNDFVEQYGKDHVYLKSDSVATEIHSYLKKSIPKENTLREWIKGEEIAPAYARSPGRRKETK